MTLTSLERIVTKYLDFRSGGWQIGRDGAIRVSMFIDLLSASHIDGHLKIMTEALSGFILETVSNLAPTLTAVDKSKEEACIIIGPKRGNSLLIRECARKLGIISGFAKEQPLFGRWLEGVIPPSSRVVIADDISSDGELLLNVVERVRDAGHRIHACVVLIDRREGDAVSLLRRHGVELRSLMNLDDEDLYRLQTRAKMED
jgi:orotate phosphoribosyltransferase